jgi:hypothetical protein
MERILTRSKTISSRMKSTKVREMDKVRLELIKLSKGFETKELKEKSLDRIFWSVVTPGNFEELEKAI